MASKLIRSTFGALAVFGAMAMSAGTASSDPSGTPLDKEFLSGPEDIKQAALYGAPTAVWEVLEHGERVECLDCISYVEPLLFNDDARIREIAAWWIRRRPFGYAEVALRIRGVLKNDADPKRRAAAASALGEFLDPGGTPLLVKAAADTDVGVRTAVLGALRRLNDPDAAPAITAGLGDGSVPVRLAAIDAASHVAGYADTGSVAKLLSDPDAVARAKACDALALFRAKGSAAGLAAIAKTDSDEAVRIAAVNALGELGDAAGKSAVDAALNDPASRVRDAAKVAQLKLGGAL